MLDLMEKAAFFSKSTNKIFKPHLVLNQVSLGRIEPKSIWKFWKFEGKITVRDSDKDIIAINVSKM